VRASLVVASAVHVAALIAVAKSHAVHAPSADDETAVWDLDLTPSPEEEEQAPPSQETPARETAHGALEAREESRSSQQGEAPASPSASTSSEAHGAPAPSGSAGQGWTFSPTGKGPIDLGIGSARGPKSFHYDPTAKVELPADERPSTTGGLVEMLDADDAKRGFGRGGPVKLSVETAARSTDAPMEGQATFDIAVMASGELSIHLVAANADFDHWNRLVEAIRNDLARKHVRIPHGSKGIHVVVEVEAHQQFPDGTSPSSLGGKVVMGPQGPAAGYRGKVCGAGISLGGLGGGCSPENAGTVATRVVSSRITRETRM